jgi:hypothetical protein
MNLLISEHQPLDAVLGWPPLWAEGLGDDATRAAIEAEPSDFLGPLPTDRLPAWYEPRISALRRALVGG